jgi:hypothetical protein
MFNCLCLSGGATKGCITLGVLDKHRRDIENVEMYVGCSVGAVIVTLLSMGATMDEVYEIGTTSSCKLPSGLQLVAAISGFFTKLGLMKDNTYLDRVEEFILDKYGNIPTMRHLYQMTGKDLYICSTALLKKKRVMFHHSTHPDLPVLDALHMSARMPLIFTPIYYDEDLYIDGGMKCHFPIDMREGRTLGIHTYNRVRSARDILESPSIIEYIGLLLSCSTCGDIPTHMDGVLYDIAYERKGPLKTSEQELLAMYNAGREAIPIISDV